VGAGGRVGAEVGGGLTVQAAAALLCLLLVSGSAAADGIPTPQQLYDRQKKSVALGVTLEALCPIAGAGALYAGDDDKATVLGILSAAGAGATVGSGLYLLHLSHQNSSGADHVVADLESGTAWTVFVAAGALYLITRISGLALAPDAVEAFNLDLQQRIGVPSAEPRVPFHAQASGLTLTWHLH
jgi:hypothetical protein